MYPVDLDTSNAKMSRLTKTLGKALYIGARLAEKGHQGT